MQRISSGIDDLDNIIDSLYIGDNVVWEVEAGTSYETFIYNFIQQSLKDRQRVFYISFNRSPQGIFNEIGDFLGSDLFVLIDCFTSGKGKNDNTFLRFYQDYKRPNVIRLENCYSKDEFIRGLLSIEGADTRGARYVFDSLTGMQDLWGDERDTYQFFTFMCPRLYDLGTVAYWILEKDAHSEKFKANLRHITQVVFDLYTRKERLFIKARKLEGREKREAFNPHQYLLDGKDITLRPLKKETSTDIGIRIKEMRMRAGMSQKELAEKVGLTASFISQIENNQISPSLNSFLQLCNALGIKASKLLEMDKKNPWFLFKKGSFPYKPVEEGIKISSILLDERLSVLSVVLPPALQLNKHFFYRKSPELICVLKGSLSVKIGDSIERLTIGDCIYLSDIFPSQWKNEGDEEAELFVIIPER